jgi:hypothetical protein
LSGLDEEGIASFNNALSQIPGLYDNAITAAEEFAAMANAG